MNPYVGQSVLFHPFAEADRLADYQPHAAIVTFVHSDRLVNLAVFNAGGESYGRTSVEILQDGEVAPQAAYTEVMPEGGYKVGPAETPAERAARLQSKA